MREPSPVREPTPIKEPLSRLEQEPTPDSPSPPSPPSSAAVGPTTSSRPPSPFRHPSVLADIREGGGDFFSSLQSNKAPQTPTTTATGGAEDSAVLTALSLKLDRCLHRVTTLENELGITKKVLGGAILKLVTRVKRLEGLLQQRKRRLVLSDSEGEDATTTDTRTTRRRLRKTFSSSVSAHVSETSPAGVRVPAAATTFPPGSSVDAVVHTAAAPSSSIHTASDKGKAPMVDDSFLADLLSEQELVLKNLHDSQLGKELAKKIHAEQEAEFARQQEELAQKAQAESVASPTEHALGMSDQRRRELDAAQLIYTEADWIDLLAKIATNSALSKQLLGDDRRELAEQSRVKPMTKTQQRDYMRDFIKNSSASVYNQAPANIPVPAVSIAQAAVSIPAELMVHPAESHMDDPLTAPAHGSSEPSIVVPPPSSSRHRCKHIAKKRVTPIVDSEEPDTFAFLMWGDLHVLFQSLDNADTFHFWCNQDSWRIRSWRLYPRAQVHVLEMLVAAGFCSCCWNKDAILEPTSADLSRILKLTMYVVPTGSEHSHSCCCVSAGKHSFCCQ
nr:hypothetical protein [Tanacetum cinerariifolium]